MDSRTSKQTGCWSCHTIDVASRCVSRGSGVNLEGRSRYWSASVFHLGLIETALLRSIVDGDGGIAVVCDCRPEVHTVRTLYDTI